MSMNITDNNRKPWIASSIFDFQYFCCPECDDKSKDKQEFVNHASIYHRGALEILQQISDGSLDNIEFPNNKYEVDLSVIPNEFQNFEIKEEELSENVDLFSKHVDNRNIIEEKLRSNEDDNPGSAIEIFEYEIKEEHTDLNDDEHTDLIVDEHTDLYVDDNNDKKLGRSDGMNEEKPFKCDICSLSFSKQSKFREHAETVHEEKRPFKCNLCPKSFLTNGTLQGHIQSVHENKSYECPSCDTKFSWKESLKRHIETVHEKKKPFKCEFCDKLFARNNKLKKHTESVHDRKKPFKCDLCEYFFSKFEALKSHKTREHEGPKIPKDDEYTCKICDKEIVKDKITHIKKYHNDKKGLKCPKCGKQFLKYNAVTEHIVDIHEKIPCSICGEMLGPKRMKNHIVFKHKGNSDRPLKCSYCGKGFLEKRYLQDHMNIHTGEKPYMCNFCGTSFASYGTFRMHERTRHLGHSRLEAKKEKNEKNIKSKR